MPDAYLYGFAGLNVTAPISSRISAILSLLMQPPTPSSCNTHLNPLSFRTSALRTSRTQSFSQAVLKRTQARQHIPCSRLLRNSHTPRTRSAYTSPKRAGNQLSSSYISQKPSSASSQARSRIRHQLHFQQPRPGHRLQSIFSRRNRRLSHTPPSQPSPSSHGR